MPANLLKMFVELGARTTGLDKGLKGVERKFKRLGSTLQNAGRSLTLGISAPLTAIGGLGLRAAVQFEDAFAEVRKTVTATPEEFKELEQSIRSMSTTLPVAAEEIAAIAAEAGRMGIAQENIESFSDTIIRLAETSTLSSEEAALALARIANITQLPQEEIGKLANAITVAGSEFAANEQEIAEFTKRIAAAGSAIGLTEGELVGFATAFSAVGIAAEAGGTAVSKVFFDIGKTVETGGERLEKFAKVAGTTSAEFVRLYRDNAAAAVSRFITGIKEMEESGQSAFNVLEELGLTEQRLSRAILSASSAGDLLTRALQRTSEAAQTTNDLYKLSEQRFRTTGSQVKVLTNQIREQQRQLGEALLPAFRDVLNIVKDSVVPAIQEAVKWFSSLDEGTRQLVLAMGSLLALSGPLLFFLGQFATVLSFIAAHPVAALFIAIGALAAAVGFLATRTEKTTKELLDLKAATLDLTDASDRLVFAQEKLRLLDQERQKSIARIIELEKRLSDAENNLRLDLSKAAAEARAALIQRQIAAERARLETIKGRIENARHTASLETLTIKIEEYNTALKKAEQRARLTGDAQALLAEKMALADQFMRFLVQNVKEGDPILELHAQHVRDLKAEYDELTRSMSLEGVPEQLAEKAEQMRVTLEEKFSEMQELSSEFQAHALEGWFLWAQQASDVLGQVGEESLHVFQQFSRGFGDAVGRAIVYGENFGQAMKRLFAGVLSSAISAFIRIAVEALVASIAQKASAALATSAQVAGHAAVAAAGTFAWMAALGPIGLAAAPGAAAAAGAGAVAAATAAGAAGKGAGLAIVGAEKGMLTLGEGLAFLHPNEIVAPFREVASMIGTGGGGTVIFQMDGREWARAMVPQIPGVITRKIGSSMF